MAKALHPELHSFNYFESLFQSSKQNNVLLLTADGIITQINPAFTKTFGYEDEDIIGKHLSVLFTKEDQDKHLPIDEISRVLSTGQSNDNNYMVHKNKSITWVTGESLLVKNPKGETAILKIIQDIHLQKSSENSLLNLNDFLERILSSIDDVVLVVDNLMNIIKVNKAFDHLFSQGETSTGVGNLLILIKSFDEQYGLSTKMTDALATGNTQVAREVSIRTITGENRMFDITCRRIKSINEQDHLLIILHDRTADYQSEKQREDIIGFVAHELRNPLANIVLANDLLSGILAEHNMTEPLSLLKRSQNNVSRLTKMISELYAATKVSSGNLLLETEHFQFDEMIKEAIETTNMLHPLYSITLHGNAPIDILGDKNKLIQVVTNYLSNGIKYSLDSNEVVLNMEHTDREIIVAVRDRGLGISKDQLPFVFNRFFRAEKTRNLEGIGLGLYLSRQIIEAHKGKVWVESEDGLGSTFYFSIPLTQ